MLHFFFSFLKTVLYKAVNYFINTDFIIAYFTTLSQPFSQILSDEERRKYSFKSPFPQEFSLPSNILDYVAKNPAFPNGHFKFISSCKFLLRMSRIIPVQDAGHYTTINTKKWKSGKRVPMIMNDQLFKFWLHDILLIYTSSMPNIASPLIKKCYKFSLREFTFQRQVLTFEELQIFVSDSHLEEVGYRQNIIKNSDGSITEFEKVFELLCCKKIEIIFPDEQHGVGEKTTQKIIEILSSEQIPDERDIRLLNIPKDFDFHLFSGFLKANMFAKQHSFELSFSDEISDAYKNQLRQFISEILPLRGMYAHTVPDITFSSGDVADFLSRIDLWGMRSGDVEGIPRKPRA